MSAIKKQGEFKRNFKMIRERFWIFYKYEYAQLQVIA